MFSSNNSQVANDVKYIEEYFSTFLYSGTGSSQTINNGIDLATKGGLTWIKDRGAASTPHMWFDTARGVGKYIQSNSTGSQGNIADTLTAFNSNGFTLGADSFGVVNASGHTYTSWSWAKTPKFFDVVTYTGDGTAGRTVAHNLGSVPGSIIVKSTSSLTNWHVYHRSLAVNQNLLLDITQAARTDNSFNSTAPTATVFSLGGGATNTNGETYVAYLFAHNAGGFGLTGTDNVISCGSFTTDGSAVGTANLGYEPQWILLKKSSGAQNWFVFDNMRGMTALQSATFSNAYGLNPNLSDAEVNYGAVNITSTGFATTSGALDASSTYIYIAIRRGPMKVPTSGTSVFAPVARSGTGSTSTVSNSITTDLIISMTRNTAGIDSGVWDRLRGITKYLATTGTATESTSSDSVTALNNTSYVLGADTATDRINRSGYTYANWTFRRAPNFFDEVCYTGTGVTHTETHNLGVAPELIIVKRRASATASWAVYAAPLTASYVGFLDLTNAFQADNMWNSTAPTSTAFTVRAANAQVNASGSTYVAYLFATCAGVSKVGSYTGTGTTGTVIDCGFTSGARFVLIKRTDSTGDWWVWDTARGMVSGTDPRLALNSTSAEANTNYILTATSGFQIVTTSSNVNASGGTYIYLAIA